MSDKRWITILKPCPFCGESAEKICYPTLTIIECKKCGVRRYSGGPHSNTPVPHDAVDALWNERAEDARIRELEAQVKAAEELPLAEFGDILGHNYWLDANTLQALWKRMREASARALSRNDAQAKKGYDYV